MKTILPPPNPPIQAYNLKDFFLYNVLKKSSKNKISYVTGDLYTNGLFIPQLRVISGRILPPQIKFTTNYKPQVLASQETCSNLYSLWMEALRGENIFVELKPLEDAMSNWGMKVEDLYG